MVSEREEEAVEREWQARLQQLDAERGTSASAEQLAAQSTGGVGGLIYSGIKNVFSQIYHISQGNADLSTKGAVPLYV